MGYRITKHFLFFHGVIDELKIYSRLLTDKEIENLYYEGMGNQ